MKRIALSAFFALLAAALLMSAAYAGDLQEALAYAEATTGHRIRIAGAEEVPASHPHDGLAMILSRDVEPGRPVADYSCDQSLIDDAQTFRTINIERWAHRACMEHRFNQAHVAGYRSLGHLRLSEARVRRLAEAAERQTRVPATILLTIARYFSGFHPAARSDRGHIGLLQLRPDLLRRSGLSTSALDDPETNMRAGAEYLAHLVRENRDLKMALAAFQDGPPPPGQPWGPRRTWFVREVMRIYYASIREVPPEIGVAAMAKFMTVY